MTEYRHQEFEKKERKFVTVFEQWRKTVKQFRKDLKQECTETVLCEMINDVKRLEDAVLKQFRDLRAAGTVTPETVRKVDACYAINIDFFKLLTNVYVKLKTLILLTRLNVLELLEEMTMRNLYLAALMIQSDPRALLSQKYQKEWLKLQLK